MAELPTKFYQYPTGEVSMAPGYNVPHGTTEVDQSAFINFINTDRAKYDDIYSRSTTPGEAERYRQIMSGQTNVGSGYTTYTNPQTGATDLIQNESLAQMNQQANDPNLVNIGTPEAPMYVPKGSAGEALNTGLKSGTVSPTDPQAQYQASLQGNTDEQGGVTPIAPSAPAPATLAPGQTPSQQASVQPEGQGTAYSEGGYMNAAGVYENPQLSKSGQYYRVGTDVFTSSGQPVDEKTFKQLGLNFDLLPNGPQEAQGVAIDQQNKKLEQANTLLSQYGITADANAFATNPIKSFGDLYKSIITQLGLPDLKSQIDTVLKEQKGMMQELADKTADINEDPWLTEGVRVSRIRKLQERYEGKLGALNSSLQLMQALYEEGAQEARFVATETLNAYNQERAFQQDQLEFAINRQDRLAAAEQDLKQQGFENQLALSQFGLQKDKFISDQQNTLFEQQLALQKMIQDGVGPDGKPLTADQLKNAGFAQRVSEANITLQTIEQQISGLSYLEYYAYQKAPNFAKPAYIQQYEQAQRNFVNAVLRRESGAAISDAEFENARQQYFAQPGDGPEVLAQKQANRQTTYEGLVQSAGGAYNSGGDDPLQLFGSGDDPLGLSFNSEGGGSINAIAEAIGKIESSGRYTAIGPATSSGNKAYGKYQIMDFNIPSWSKEVLGYSITPQQFLKSPELQDQIAYAKMGQIYEQYGDPRQVASIWFSGRPMAGNTSADVTGTNVPEYIRRFTEALNSYA